MFHRDLLTTLSIIALATEALVFVALLVWALGSRAPVRRRKPGRVSRFRAEVVVATVALGGCLVAAVIHPITPRIHDEFAYLLGAQTFAQGRMTNPTPMLARHFETEHILVTPTYSSKYPPGQSLAMAASLVVTGSPAPAIWLSVALLAASIVWMLRPIGGRRWALAGGMMVAVSAPVIVWWGHTYWGGAIAGIGGALVYGALLRLGSRPRFALSLLLGTGIAILALTRPFEGAIFSLPALLALLWRVTIASPGVPLLAAATRIALPASIPIAVAVYVMMAHNQAVTGNALVLPYMMHAEQYSAAPSLWIQDPLPEPIYRHEQLRGFYIGYERRIYRSYHRLGRLLELSGQKLIIFWAFFIGPSLSIAAILGMGVFILSRKQRRPEQHRRPRNGRAGHALVVLGAALTCAFGAASVIVWFHPHYIAAALGPVLALHLLAIRAMETGGRIWHARMRRVVRACIGARAAGLVGVLIAIGPVERDQAPAAAHRQAIIEQLQRAGGTHLVMVEQDVAGNPHVDWVFNDADFDSAPILWARRMGDEGEQELLDAFPDRTPWLLDLRNSALPELRPYPDMKGHTKAL